MTQQLWLAWGRGELSDAEAQTAAEAAHEHNRARHRGGHSVAKPVPAAVSESPRRHARDRTIGHKCPQARAKVFGLDHGVPLDRNAKARVFAYARALTRRTEKGKAYGAVTAKALEVLRVLLWGFHNAATGRCFPSYEAIAERAACSRTMVYEAIRMLERVGIMTWCNRLVRIRERVAGLFGPLSATRWRVVRTSNAYGFVDPASKFTFRAGTLDQVPQERGGRGNDDASGQAEPDKLGSEDSERPESPRHAQTPSDPARPCW
jgi:hypothetical protein